MGKIRKSTMVEFVSELESLLVNSSLENKEGILFMIKEAKAGEYHDFKNNKYACGKVEASSKLRGLGLIDLAKRIEDGEFDEQPDEDDKLSMKKDLIDAGFPEAVANKIVGI